MVCEAKVPVYEPYERGRSVHAPDFAERCAEPDAVFGRDARKLTIGNGERWLRHVLEKKKRVCGVVDLAEGNQFVSAIVYDAATTSATNVAEIIFASRKINVKGVVGGGRGHRQPPVG